MRSACLCVCLSVLLCVCVCPREYISGTAGPIFTKFFVQIFCGRGSVLLWRCCDTLCTSISMDDVMFGRNGPYGPRGVAIPGRSLMSVNVLFSILCWSAFAAVTDPLYYHFVTSRFEQNFNKTVTSFSQFGGPNRPNLGTT